MKKTNSTQDLIGIKRFSSNGVKTDKSEIAFFSVKPTNISVLSKTSIEIKITKLMQLLSANPDIEIICISNIFYPSIPNGHKKVVLEKNKKPNVEKIYDKLVFSLS